MSLLLNTLPKSGSNLLTVWLAKNDFNLRASISPTRFLGRRAIIPRLVPTPLRRALFLDIGLETEANYDYWSFRAKLRLAHGPQRYVVGHIQHSPLTAREINVTELPIVYVTRHHYDVINSYSTYVANTKTHAHYKLYNELGERAFLTAMVHGERVGKLQFRRFFDQLKRFDQWQKMPETITLNYTEYCQDPTEVGKRFCEKFEERLNVRVKQGLSSAFGKGHTYHRGGNDAWRKNKVLVDIIDQWRDGD